MNSINHMSNFCIPFVAGICIRRGEDGVEVLLQTRWKPGASPYSGLLEIPAGVIEQYENIYTALRREILEETGMMVTKIYGEDATRTVIPHENDCVIAFTPFACQQALQTRNGLPWVGYTFVCVVEGELKPQLEETRDPHWMSISQLQEALANTPEKFFPLQIPVLQKFCEEGEGYIKSSPNPL